MKTERLAQALFLSSQLAAFVRQEDCLAPGEDGTPCYVLECRSQQLSLQNIDPSGLCDACSVRLSALLLTLSIGFLGTKLGYNTKDLDELSAAFGSRIDNGAWPPAICGCQASKTAKATGRQQHLFAPCLELGLADVRPRKSK